MGVRTKGRRKIVHENNRYFGYVEEDYESPYYLLHIISDDKRLILSCPLQTKTAYIISKGILFQNCKSNGHWNRYILPFDVPETVTPKFVSKILSFATKDTQAVTIDWDGKDIPV